MIDNGYPIDHQSLLLWAIKNRTSVIGEFLSRQYSWRLWTWATGYAKEHGLMPPVFPADYGIYFQPDEEEETELRELGLLPEGWEAIKADRTLWW